MLATSREERGWAGRSDSAGARVLGGSPGGSAPSLDGYPVYGVARSTRLEQLGDAAFRQAHGLRYAYVAGAMANGIASEELVEAMARGGMLGVFGAAGLSPERVEQAIDRLETRLGTLPWASNLIHSPSEPRLEATIVDLYLRRGVRRVSASAYLKLTLPLVRYRVAQIHRSSDGRIVAPNSVLAKVSRVEVARQFLEPAPEAMLRELIARGDIDENQAVLASQIPMAEDITVEADSGGHTDNRSALTLLPTMLALRDRITTERGYGTRPRMGLGGGIATPASVLAAFSMGAAYVVTGTVNQACREAGTSDLVRQMLAEADQADVTMAPAADMFEMGVELQVLKRGTFFPMRARKLYDAYRSHDSMNSIPTEEREQLERTVFRQTLDQVWQDTEEFWRRRDPVQLERALRDEKHRMALTFRWYLGQSSRWANAGVEERRADFQIWCGPAMGAFNEWVRGSWLEPWQERRVVPVAMNLLHGAAVLSRYRALGLDSAGVALRSEPLQPAEIEEFLQ